MKITKKRLINANALLKKARLMEYPDGNGIYCLTPAVSVFAIEDATTVDAVEVVRCKDCVHYNVYRLECHNGYMNGIIDVNGFCSYGEKRGDSL